LDDNDLGRPRCLTSNSCRSFVDRQHTETFHNWQTVAWGEERTPTTNEKTAKNVGVPDVTPTYSNDQHGAHSDQPGFCASVNLAGIKKHDYVLTPGRYVGAAAEEDDVEPFVDKMARLTATLKTQFEESDRLEAEIKKNLAGLGFDV